METTVIDFASARVTELIDHITEDPVQDRPLTDRSHTPPFETDEEEAGEGEEAEEEGGGEEGDAEDRRGLVAGGVGRVDGHRDAEGHQP